MMDNNQAQYDAQQKKIFANRKISEQNAVAEYEGTPNAADNSQTSDNYVGYNPEISVVTNEAIQGGANPLALALAKKHLGRKEYVGYCQRFVRNMTGQDITGASAIDAWNKNQNRAVQGLDGIKPGDAVYFAPDKTNEYYGHTGIYAGNGQYISAINSGIQQRDLTKWQKNTGQRVLGYIPQGGTQ